MARFTIAPTKGSKRQSNWLAAICFLLALVVAGGLFRNELLSPGKQSKPDMLRGEGLQALQRGQYPQASALLLKAFTADPKRLDILNDYCATLTLQGRYGTALQTLRALLRQQPNNQQALGNLGSLYLAMGNPQDAIPPLEQAVKLDPNDAHASNLLVRAKSLSRGATPRTPGNDSVKQHDRGSSEGEQGDHLRLAKLYARQRKFSLALEECNRILASAPRSAEARRLRTQIMTTISDNLDKPASLPAPLQGPVAPGTSR